MTILLILQCTPTTYFGAGNIDGQVICYDWVSLLPDITALCRFWMKRPLYLRIVQAVEEQDPWFKQRRNVAGKLGLSSLQKVTVAF